MNVEDLLLGKTLRVKTFFTSTFDSLRHKIQAAQIKHGLRLLPTHMQRLTVGGVEYPGNAAVHDVLRNGYSVVLVEPRVSELVSFFLAGVCDLRDADTDDIGVASGSSPPATRSDSEHVCIFGDMDDFNLDIPDGEKECTQDVGGGGGSTSSSGSRSSSLAPPSGFSPSRSPCLSPLLTVHDASMAEPSSTLGFALLQPVLDALSGHVTPVRECRIAPAALPGSYEERVAVTALLPMAAERLALDGGSAGASLLRFLLLREASVAEEHYTSHLHLIVSGGCGEGEDASMFLRRFRLGDLADLAMTVQSGLRHGHAPRQGSGGGARGFDYGRLVDGCCGGTYVMSDASGVACAVFKPADEEPYAPLNPKVFCTLV